MMRTAPIAPALALSLACGLTCCSPAKGDDWTNSGGNAGRNGQSAERGPDAPTVLWSTGRPSIIAWLPVTLGDRLFIVRQNAFPPNNAPNDAPVVAMDLNTGAELWTVNLPFNTGDWTTFIAGARDGRVYCSRSGGGGAGTPAAMYAFDAVTGNPAWPGIGGAGGSTGAGPYDGVVFAPNGDLVVGDFRKLTRLRATDGSIAWQMDRVGSVSGSCGGCVNAAANAVYIADAAAGGTVLKRYDLDTGAFRYASPVMPGFTTQSTPFVGPDGTVYFSRTQNNAPVDNFYAFDDTGSAFTQRWTTPAAWTTTGEFGATSGAVFMLSPGYVLEKRDAGSGSVLATATIVGHSYAQRMAVDSLGRLFYSDGDFNTARVYSLNADLSTRWSVSIPAVNIGAPTLAAHGTLIAAGTGPITAYRTAAPPACYPNCDESTIAPVLNVLDFNCFLNRFSAGDSYANCDQSTVAPVLNVLDFNCFLNAFAAGCP
jgi:hypothetical protein